MSAKSTFFSFLISLAILMAPSSCKAIQLNEIHRQEVNPLQYGLEQARTDVDRYYVLLHTHQSALQKGIGVSYFGIKEIVIEIPPKAISIPLTNYTDFAGVKLIVKNNRKNLPLFTLSNKLIPVNADGEEIDNGDFSSNSALRSGRYLVVITDNTPWVGKRIGYDYGATRKDIMIVENGIASNAPVQSYCSLVSRPVCAYREIGYSTIVFKNLTFIRDASSSKKTYLLKIENQCDVELSKISITTPDGSGMYGDRIIDVGNCINVTFDEITINGTYSTTDKYGYGVSFDNVCNVCVINMYGRGTWGIFGNNNVHNAVLRDCDINRFDIHCYGKDVFFEGCNFINLYNQFASVYGTISFRDCSFTNFRPVYIGSSYNAYTPYDILFERCTFNMDKNHSSIVDFAGFSKTSNLRPELSRKSLPNVTMVDCQINMVDDTNKWFVYNTKKMGDYQGAFSYISQVIIRGLSEDTKKVEMGVFSKKINSIHTIEIVKD